VVVNRVVPVSATGEFAANWRRMQARYLTDIDAMFDPIPILHVPQFPDEVVGLAMLRRMAEAMHGDSDPAAVLVTEKAYHIRPIDGGYEFQIPAPFVEKPEASLMRHGDELIVRMGAARRNIVLPRVLARMQHSSGKLENGYLTIEFTPRTEGASDQQR